MVKNFFKFFYRKRKFLILVLVILFPLIFLGFYKLKQGLKISSIASSSGEITTLPLDQKSIQLPPEIKIEAGANVIRNYTTDNPGRFDATVVFESKKSAADNFYIYKSMLEKNGWKVASFSQNQENYQTLYASKEGKSLGIIFNQNIVGITYTKPK